MLALGQRVRCLTVNESEVRNLPGARRMAAGRVIYINRPNRWFLVAYRGARGERLREGFSFHDLGRLVVRTKRRKKT